MWEFRKINTLDTKDSQEDVKSRLVYNRKETRKWLSREETASPKVSLEIINLTFAIDAHEEPNAFVQTCMPMYGYIVYSESVVI